VRIDPSDRKVTVQLHLTQNPSNLLNQVLLVDPLIFWDLQITAYNSGFNN